MAVQELSREQAKEEIKKLKKEMKEDSSKEEENLKAIEELMDQIEKRSKDKKDPVSSDKPDPGKKKNVLYAKNGGSVKGKRLTRTVPPKKGPNSQGMRGTGAAIRGTKFKGVF